jgi:type VI secretion system secreted protein VgrG
MDFKQKHRPLRVTTPLGEDKFILTSLTGRERISEIFEFELNVAWQGASPVVFKDLLGKSVTAEIEFHGSTRFFNGIVKSISQSTRVGTANIVWYSLSVVPILWMLTRKVNCRIFQQKTAAEIIEGVLKESGVTDLEIQLNRTYTARDYCVQYNESDFDFVSRLMEFEGIYYFFKHEENKHTMVLSDDRSAIADTPDAANIAYGEVFGLDQEEGWIHEWARGQEVNSGKFTLVDHNFETPSSDLKTHASSTVNVADNSHLEIYRNPGDYTKPSPGQEIVTLRVAEEETRTQRVHGQSSNCFLRPGYKFTLKHHPFDDGKYTVTGITHQAQQPLDTDDAAAEFKYQNQFECIAFSTVYRPPLVTPRPSIRGVQTAVVVGPGGEEIYTDKYGRVKVQFHWDREGKKDENSSCWCRVATYWAGKTWGAIHIPRIGQEVIVDFLEGDVDRPLIIGSVYNAEQMPPYALPDNKTRSTLKSNSSKGGGGFNEIRLEDKKDSEEVYFHAQKDLNSVVENNETRKVGSSKADDGSRTTEIYKDETFACKTGNESHTVEKGNQTVDITMGNQSITVGKGNQSTEIKMGNQSTAIKMGNQTTKLDLGAASHEAMQSITLKVGQNSIVIDQTGITIKGLMITVQGQVMVKVTAPMTQVNGDGMTMVKGGIVMIN